MGQEVGVTPLQLVTAVSSIANGGTLYKPHVVSQLRRGDQILPMTGPLAPSEPKEVIRPETAATLRRLMEGVVLNGTGKLARLDGWTVAGKTGSAQKIDPNTGRYSPTQLIASFSGFAPINDPAVTILVSLDSPVGQHEGGQVAAPVFKRVAEQVLAYLDVPRDVPLSPRLIQASYKRAEAQEVATLEDFTPVDFGSQPDQPPPSEPIAKGVKGRDLAAEPANPSLTVALDEGGDIALPDFQGKTMRDVTEMCLRLGLEPVLVGSGLATDEAPLAGTKVRRGAKITLRFGDTDAPAKLASSQRNSQEPMTTGLREQERSGKQQIGGSSTPKIAGQQSVRQASLKYFRGLATVPPTPNVYRSSRHACDSRKVAPEFAFFALHGKDDGKSISRCNRPWARSRLPARTLLPQICRHRDLIVFQKPRTWPSPPQTFSEILRRRWIWLRSLEPTARPPLR
jgi:membrane peptidoglycan carboxypeptidase